MRLIFLTLLPFVVICAVTDILLRRAENRPETPALAADANRDTPAIYHLPDVESLRDCGGWRTLDGRRVRKGRIFRSAEFNHREDRRPNRNFVLSTASRAFLTETLGIKTDLDLRSEKETETMTASPLGPQVRWVRAPSRAYAKIATDEGRAAFRTVFRTLLDETAYPVAIHCRAGRDQAGTVVFLLNALLGVAPEDLRYDWELTERLKGNGRFDYSLIRGVDAALFRYPGATVNEKAEAFVLSLGFTREDVQRFRDLMLAP
ncbi:MAG: tyrosine-protein phosphatase [Kiritimatiellia bacterium]